MEIKKKPATTAVWRYAFFAVLLVLAGSFWFPCAAGATATLYPRGTGYHITDMDYDGTGRLYVTAELTAYEGTFPSCYGSYCITQQPTSVQSFSNEGGEQFITLSDEESYSNLSGLYKALCTPQYNINYCLWDYGGTLTVYFGQFYDGGHSITSPTGITKSQIDAVMGTDYMESRRVFYSHYHAYAPGVYEWFDYINDYDNDLVLDTGEGIFFPFHSTNTPVMYYGDEPILTPSYPVPATSNYDADLSFSAGGDIEIPADNSATWTDLYAYFDAIQGGVSESDLVWTGELTAGQSDTYAAAVDLEPGVYRVRYYLAGYSMEGVPSYISALPVSYILDDGNTIVRSEDYIPVYTPPTYPDMPTPEDCDSLSQPEKTICQLQNWLAAAFLPTSAEVAKLQAAGYVFQTKFPWNYVAVLSDRVNFWKTNFVSNEKVEITVMGTTQEWDPSALASMDLFIAVRGLIAGLLCVIFILWAINWFRKII